MTGIYALLAVALCGLAMIGLFTAGNLLRRLLAINVLGSAVFLLLVAVARKADALDPVPHAMVLTGIVVSVSTTAVALALILHGVEARRKKEQGQHD
ncbi:NADH-quinone oxidoreductase subunit K [Marinospirillum alkaliphilum]|uniref:Multisubunit sodium/proton antiporter, MrpC subunit n=1 Tax=Marinospirillum alkaliphilum DSM 21637 TaxID=1122209 RepID=A0A1K1ZZN6_9GAMM|nr:NADH-quinone oxidoreductase subunit K [Marinospirillum alkaliphilum]SFX79654.1 multisubunit sodium/proton antiporter, MrpC subunit [Marinospirillum alkaliphilum DSM 21637]